jgi:hypothetical protein
VSVPLLRVLITAGVSRFRTLNRFTLADVSWSRLLRLDGVDELGRRSRRLPPENQGIYISEVADKTSSGSGMHELITLLL